MFAYTECKATSNATALKYMILFWQDVIFYSATRCQTVLTSHTHDCISGNHVAIAISASDMKLIVLNYHIIIAPVVIAKRQMPQPQSVSIVGMFLYAFFIIKPDIKPETEGIHRQPVVHVDICSMSVSD